MHTQAGKSDRGGRSGDPSISVQSLADSGTDTAQTPEVTCGTGSLITGTLEGTTLILVARVQFDAVFAQSGNRFDRQVYAGR
jgi:hypothetical protein